MARHARSEDERADRTSAGRDRFRFGRVDGPGLITRFPGMIYQCRNDRDWTLHFVSEGTRDLTGYEPSAFLEEDGVVFADLIRAGDREAVWAGVQEAIAENRPFELEYRILTASGDERWVWERGHPVWSEDGDLLGLEGFISDVTERKLEADELERTLEVLETLTDQSLFGVYVIHEGRFLYVNETLARIFGYEREEVEGQLSPADLASEEDHRKVESNIARRLKGEVKDLQYAFRGRRKDGEPVDVEVHGSRVRYDGGWAISGVLLDVTPRRELEEQLRVAQKREALAELTGTVTHDFNNFLTAILGAVDLATLDLPEDSPALPSLDLATRTVERARSLTLQLLSFSRTRPAKLKVFDLNGVVEDMALLLRQLVGSPIRLDLDLAPEPLAVRADWSTLEQVIMNLTVNARDAMPRGGTVTLRTHRSSPVTHEKPPRAVLELSDTGDGIGQADLERIFEPFYTTKKLGTGLGLSTVRRLVEEADGEVSVTSKVGAGTSFRITLPLRDAGGIAPEPAVDVPPEHSEAGRADRILVVEDDDSVRQVMATALTRAGHDVTAVRSAGAALDVCRNWESAPSLVIVDYSLPDRNGVDLASELRARWDDTYVLLSSGFVSSEIAGAELDFGRSGFLEKPFSVDDLLRVVRKALAEVVEAGPGD